MTVKTKIGLALVAVILFYCNLVLSWIGLRHLEQRRVEFSQAFNQISIGMPRERVRELLAGFGPPERTSKWWSQSGDFDRYAAILTHRPPDFVIIKYVDGKVVSAALENGDRIVAHRFDPATYSYFGYWSGSVKILLMMFDVSFLFCFEAILVCGGLALLREVRKKVGTIALIAAFPVLLAGLLVSSTHSMLFYIVGSWM